MTNSIPVKKKMWGSSPEQRGGTEERLILAVSRKRGIPRRLMGWMVGGEGFPPYLNREKGREEDFLNRFGREKSGKTPRRDAAKRRFSGEAKGHR